MRVKRNFDRIYRNEIDPWAIGNADDPRYDLYRDLLLAHVRGGAILDIGCGLGAFLARFAGTFDELVGVETAAEAVRRGRELRPEIQFVHAPAEQLTETPLDGRSFDAIVVSDVLYYLHRRDRIAVLDWVARHLAADGRALIAGWCPGGRYLEADEFRALVRASFRVLDDVHLPSDHVVLVTRTKRRLAAFATAAVAGLTCVPAAGEHDLGRRAVAALPREPTPERLRLRRRLTRRTPAVVPTGDDLVVVVGLDDMPARSSLEAQGFGVVSLDELLRQSAEQA
jgi:SAM-dependent methyltransferase